LLASSSVPDGVCPVSRQWATAAFLLLLVIVPYLTSFLSGPTRGWCCSSEGIINSLLLKAGLIDTPLKLLYSAVGVHVGMVHVLLPLMILRSTASWSASTARCRGGPDAGRRSPADVPPRVLP